MVALMLMCASDLITGFFKINTRLNKTTKFLRTFHLKLHPLNTANSLFSDDHLIDVDGDWFSHHIEPNEFLYEGYIVGRTFLNFPQNLYGTINFKRTHPLLFMVLYWMEFSMASLIRAIAVLSLWRRRLNILKLENGPTTSIRSFTRMTRSIISVFEQNGKYCFKIRMR